METEKLNKKNMAEGAVVKNCPLQLPVIERLLKMYTNEGDTVFTPFLGIGSEVYQSILMKRKGIGIELKTSYYNCAVENCKAAEQKNEELRLF